MIYRPSVIFQGALQAACTTALLCATSTAIANIDVVFQESAPKDRFSVTNTSNCVYAELLIEIDLSNTAGKLIFDTTSKGAGVEVYQAFEIREGDVSLVSSTSVLDGDTALTLKVSQLEPQATASFTIDVDDTLPAGELGMIRVADSEISGGQVHVHANGGEKISMTFDGNSRLSIPLPGCG